MKKDNKILYCVPADVQEEEELHYQPGMLIADETMEGLVELGAILRKIHNRLISEGWTIDLKKGVFISPEGEVKTLRKK